MIYNLLCAIRDGISKLVESMTSSDSTTNTLLVKILDALNADNSQLLDLQCYKNTNTGEAIKLQAIFNLATGDLEAYVDQYGKPYLDPVTPHDDPCECLKDCPDCDDTPPDNTEKNIYKLADFLKQETKIGFDAPAFNKAHTGISPDGWDKASLAAQLNADAALATPVNNDSGIDYTGTTWAAHATEDAVVASGANIPATLDFASINISVPVSII